MSLKDEYYKKCATCINYGLLNPADVNHIGFKCHEKGGFYALDDSCSSGLFGGYSYNKKVSEKNISDAIKMVAKNQKSGCYITTVVCKILEEKDNCFCLRWLRFFRDKVLKQDEKYAELLYQYDHLGPQISYYLMLDPYKEELAHVLLDYYIKPITEFIIHKHYDEAIENYIQMTKELQKRYSIDQIDYNNEYQDLTNAGHGIVRKI